jgi:septum formation protein
VTSQGAAASDASGRAAPDPHRLLLASGSPRRRALLAMAGFAFGVVTPDVDEKRRDGETPAAMVRRLARSKAEAGARHGAPGALILACDTTVALGDDIFGKPVDRDAIVAMVLALAGRTHSVFTGYALATAGEEGCEVGLAETRVTMRDVTRDEAAAYAATGESLDMAGAYALQGEGGRLVATVDGSRSNVIGLPLEEVVPLLRRHGIIPRRDGTPGGGPVW